nr:PREDICTED: BLOC-1-related complex subunit 7 [Bos indicus]
MKWIFNMNKWEIILLYIRRLLGQAARNMVLQEDAILHSEDSLRKMAIITTHLQYQQEAIQKNVEQSSNLQDQLNHLLK